MKRIGYIDGRRIAGFVLRGTAGLDGIYLPITDQLVLTSGRARGLHISYTSTGAKSGTSGIRTLCIDTFINNDVPSVNGIDLYRAAIDNHTISRLTSLEIYNDNRGNAVTAQYDIMIGRNSNAVLTGPGNDAFIYFREHATVQEESCILMLQGNQAAEYLIVFGSNQDTGLLLLESSAAGESVTHRVRCNTTIGVRWLHLHDQ